MLHGLNNEVVPTTILKYCLIKQGGRMCSVCKWVGRINCEVLQEEQQAIWLHVERECLNLLRNSGLNQGVSFYTNHITRNTNASVVTRVCVGSVKVCNSQQKMLFRIWISG